ncbi:MAG: hypothetical protein V1793_22110 [Pseudomonadota bacterium]
MKRLFALAVVMIVCLSNSSEAADSIFVSGRQALITNKKVLPKYSAQIKSTVTESGLTYHLDDAGAENAVGLLTGGDFMWLNELEAASSGERITRILVGRGLPGSSSQISTSEYKVILYDDPTDDGDPSDAILLSSADLPASGPMEGDFQVVAIPTVTVEGKFFVAMLASNLPKTDYYPALLDENTPAGKSWSVGSSTPNGLDPYTLDNTVANDEPLLKNEDLGFPGNWLIRASSDSGYYTAYLPHITGGFDSFNDHLKVNNLNTITAYFDLILYDNSGSECYRQSYFIYPSDLLDLDLKGINPLAQTGKILYTDSKLHFRQTYEYNYGVTCVAESYLPDETYSSLCFFFTEMSSQLTVSKGMALANLGTHSVNITFFAHGGGRLLETSPTYVLGPNQKITGTSENFFSAVSPSDIDAVLVKTDDYPTLTGLSMMFFPDLPAMNCNLAKEVR